MTKFFEAADLYISQCRWQDIALLKFCLLALGIMIGMGIPRKRKNAFCVITSVIFGFTLVPMLMKFYGACKEVGMVK